jgi:hypothetical protein
MKRRIEVRKKPDGSVDEVLLYIDDECVMHLEYMDDNKIWIGLYDGRDYPTHVRMGSAKPIQTVVEDGNEE